MNFFIIQIAKLELLALVVAVIDDRIRDVIASPCTFVYTDSLAPILSFDRSYAFHVQIPSPKLGRYVT
jgi:hypothetical protein